MSLLKSREEILEAIAAARTIMLSYLVRPELASFLGTRLPHVVEMLDAIEARVRATDWPPRTGTFEDVRIGLYAVRELDEIDDHALSRPLYELDYALKAF